MGILSFSELITKCNNENKSIYELSQEEEARISETDIEIIRLKTLENLIAMRDAIKNASKSQEKSATTRRMADICSEIMRRLTRWRFRLLM